MQLRYCTLTGIDQSVSLEALRQLVQEYPFVEFGVLYSKTRAGKGRYPALDWIDYLANNAEELGLPRLALHICGTAVGEFIEGGDIVQLASKFGRIQLNFRSEKFETDAIVRAIQLVAPQCRVITQVNDANANLGERLRYRNCYNHEMLFDKSGGKGISPDDWPAVDRISGGKYGYAGGLGPENLAAELPRIAQAAGDAPVWIDMEGKLRNADDQFDVERARACLAAVQSYLIAHAQSRLGPDKTGTQPVESLSTLWLDWWVGFLSGYNMVMPGSDAIKATYLHRHDGRFYSSEFVENWHDCGSALDKLRVGVMPHFEGVGWTGMYVPVDGSAVESVEGRTAREAIMRAIVCRFAGRSVPVNPLEYQGEFASRYMADEQDADDDNDDD